MSDYRTMALTQHLSTLLSEGRPAKQPPQLESAAATVTHGGAGLSTSALLARLSPDGLWLKTLEALPLFATLLESALSEEYSQPYPKWGIACRGELGARATWERPTSASVSSSSGNGWPTPSASDGEGLRTLPEGTTSTGMTPDGKKRMVGLNNAAQLWPTPQAHDATPGDPSRVGRFGTTHGGRNLNDEAALEEQRSWPTPRASDGDHGGPNQRGSNGGLMLPSAAAQWATPCARNHKGVDNRRKERGAHTGDSLPTQIERKANGQSGQLSPSWVSMLQGLPPTYLDLTDSLEDVTAWVRDPQWPARPRECQHDFEPPRLGTGIKERVKKLRALGNICVTPQCTPIFVAIMDEEAR